MEIATGAYAHRTVSEEIVRSTKSSSEAPISGRFFRSLHKGASEECKLCSIFIFDCAKSFVRCHNLASTFRCIFIPMLSHSKLPSLCHCLSFPATWKNLQMNIHSTIVALHSHLFNNNFLRGMTVFSQTHIKLAKDEMLLFQLSDNKFNYIFSAWTMLCECEAVRNFPYYLAH